MEAFVRPPVTRKCIVCDILAEIDPVECDRAKRALAAKIKVWPHTAIVANFGMLGQTVSETSVRTHRKRCA